MQNNILHRVVLIYKYSCVFTLLLIFSTWLHADSLQVKSSVFIDAVEGYGFQLRGVAITLDAGSKDNLTYQVNINSAVLPNNKRHIKDIELLCLQGSFSKQEISCDKGELSFADSLMSASSSPISFNRKNSGDVSVQIDSLQLAQGNAAIELEMQQGKWQAHVDSQNLSLAILHTSIEKLPEWSLTGYLNGNITFDGAQSTILAINGSAMITGLAFSNQESTLVGEDVTAKVSLAATRVKRIWENDFSTTIFNGELYFDPVFIDANKNPKDLYGSFDWKPDANQIVLAPVHFEDQHAIHLMVNTSVDYKMKKTIAPIRLSIDYVIFPQAYEDYLQSFLFDSNFSDLQTSGSLTGEFEIDETIIHMADFKLERLSIYDRQKRFSLTNLDGEIGWGKQYANNKYVIGFSSANIYKFNLGQSEFSFFNQDEALVLSQAANVPLLDGAINIESFLIRHPGKKDQSIELDLSLSPISMNKVASIFEWPKMKGNLAGYAPSVVYEQGNVDVQGALLIRAFGGDTTIHNLQAHDLFSLTPKLFADIEINNLNLGSLTETFSFGEITGKLDGYINNLQFVSWQPTQFDAWLGTPKNDNTKHRISQTAVDNLTQVGNGASNILSKSFLSIFDSFGYDQLGIGCRLKNSTCEMRGVTSGEKGFYIVKGSGIPRIDIIGFTDEVSWPVLTARLNRIVSTQELVVE